MANGEPQLARDVLDNAIARYPHNANLRVARADFLLSIRDESGALKELRAALDEDPQNIRALQMKADIHVSRKEWSAAEDTLAKLKAVSPEQPIGYYQLGLVYEAQKKSGQAIAEFETASTKAPGAAEPLAAIVNLLLAQGKTDEAIARLNQALRASPGQLAPHILLSDIYANQKKYGQAEAELRKALETNPKAPGPYWSLANLRLAQGDTKAAIELFQKGLTVNPGDRVLSQGLAESYQTAGDNDKAIVEYEKLLKRRPDDEVAANNLASLLTDAKGDRASLERALELTKRFEQSSNPSFVDTVGWVYFKLGQTERGLSLLQRAAAIAPRNPVFQYHLGMAMYQQGDMKSAKTHLQQALDAKVNFAGIEQAKSILAKL
jgi:tetratricopeptide (TPR) repeat protein